MPISACFASSGPFTPQPITATVIFLCIVCKKSSISFAIGIKSYCILQHFGKAISVGDSYNLQSFNISFATFIYFTGSADSDTLIVSPMSSLNNVPKPILELTVPLNSVPACVTPKCKGYFIVFAASS